jgi:hypothetical protein
MRTAGLALIFLGALFFGGGEVSGPAGPSPSSMLAVMAVALGCALLLGAKLAEEDRAAELTAGSPLSEPVTVQFTSSRGTPPILGSFRLSSRRRRT